MPAVAGCCGMGWLPFMSVLLLLQGAVGQKNAGSGQGRAIIVQVGCVVVTHASIWPTQQAASIRLRDLPC